MKHRFKSLVASGFIPRFILLVGGLALPPTLAPAAEHDVTIQRENASGGTEIETITIHPAIEPVLGSSTLTAALDLLFGSTTSTYLRDTLASLADAASWRTALNALAQDGDGSQLTNLNGSAITTGTVPEARIASTIARDSEVAAGYQPLDADLTTLAGLTPTQYGVIIGDGTNFVVDTTPQVAELLTPSVQTTVLPGLVLQNIAGTEVARFGLNGTTSTILAGDLVMNGSISGATISGASNTITNLSGSAITSGIAQSAVTDLTSDLNARAKAGGVWFAAAGEATLAVGTADFGLNDFAISIDSLSLDDYTPSTAGGLFSSHSTGDNRVVVSIQTDGDWRLSFTDSGSTTTDYDITPTTALSDSSTYAIAVVADRDGNATLYVDGLANGTVAISGDSDVDIGDGNANAGELMTDANLVGSMQGFAGCNTLLTASQIAEIHEQGIQSWLARNPQYRWGESSPSYESNFSAGSNGWSTNFGTATGNIDGIGGEDDVIEYFADTSFRQNHQLVRSTAFPTAEAGDWVWYQFDYYIPSTNTNVIRIDLPIVGALPTTNTPAENITGDLNVLDAWTTVSGFARIDPASTLPNFIYLEPADLGGGPYSGAGNNTDDVFYMKNFRSKLLGVTALLPMDEGVGYQLRDLSDNHNDALLDTTGFQHLIPKSYGSLRDFNLDIYNGGSGNVALFDGSRDTLPEGAVLTELSVLNQGSGAVNQWSVALSNAGTSPTTVTTSAVAVSNGNIGRIQIDEYGTTVGHLTPELSSTDSDATNIDATVHYVIQD